MLTFYEHWNLCKSFHPYAFDDMNKSFLFLQMKKLSFSYAQVENHYFHLRILNFLGLVWQILNHGSLLDRKILKPNDEVIVVNYTWQAGQFA